VHIKATTVKNQPHHQSKQTEEELEAEARDRIWKYNHDFTAFVRDNESGWRDEKLTKNELDALPIPDYPSGWGYEVRRRIELLSDNFDAAAKVFSDDGLLSTTEMFTYLEENYKE
jgi:hypothetical protein